MPSGLQAALRERADAIPFVDTHEHLLEETTRLAGPGAHDLQPCVDAALLFFHYSRDDLWSAGMPREVEQELYAPEGDPRRKWALVEPYWRRTRHTGYLRAVAESCRLLYGVEQMDAAAFELVSQRMREE